MEFNGNGESQILIEAKEKFEHLFGDSRGSVCIIAPASLILFGDHTHYNDGVLLSAAVNKYFTVIMKKRKDSIINLASVHSDSPVSISLYKIENSTEEKFRLIKNLVKILFEENLIGSGFDCMVSNNIPECLGLGATAAQRVAFMTAVKKTFNIEISNESMMGLIRRSELEMIGKISNLAHHYTVAFGRHNKLLYFDLKTAEYKNIPLNSGSYSLVVLDTDLAIDEVQSICNERIEECEVGVKGLRLYIWGIKNLRDVEMDFLSRHVHMLPRRIFNRVYYNVNERQRCEQALKELKKNNLTDFGVKIFESHMSLSRDYELSSEPLDFIVENSRSFKGVLGAKMISCSPKRCVFALVEKSQSEAYASGISRIYKEKYNSGLKTHILDMVDGVKQFTTKKIVHSPVY